MSVNTQTSTFTVDIQNKVATVAFNRPDKANALHKQGWWDLKSTFEELDENPEVRAIVLHGEGKHFCAGIDLSLLMSFQQLNNIDCDGRKREAFLHAVRHLQACVNAIENCRKP
ncbi:MAG: enoyl-CoA hydratase-related protein, partial [Bacteroidota bacterium]